MIRQRQHHIATLSFSRPRRGVRRVAVAAACVLLGAGLAYAAGCVELSREEHLSAYGGNEHFRKIPGQDVTEESRSRYEVIGGPKK